MFFINKFFQRVICELVLIIRILLKKWLFCVLIVIMFLSAYHTSKSGCSCFVYDCLIGLGASSAVGLIIAIITDKEVYETEKNLVHVYSSILNNLIEKYKVHLFWLITPISKYRGQSNGNEALDKDFKLSDMQEMFAPSLVVQSGLSLSRIEAFFESESELIKYAIALTTQTRLVYFPKLHEMMLGLISASYKDNCSLTIRKHLAQKSTICNKIEKEAISGKLDMICTRHKKGKDINGLVQAPYIYLYKMILEERKIIKAYESWIDSNKL